MPPDVLRLARWSYRQFTQDPSHPGLNFKCVHATLPIYSARIGITHRTLGRMEGDRIVWFWIGDHATYERMLSRF